MQVVFGHSTYLVFELAWGIPVIALQWAVGRSVLLNHRRTLACAIGIGTLYLTAVDAIALAEGIWSLNPARVTGLAIGNEPIEESIFFLLTNAMVVQSVILVLRGPWLGRRLRSSKS